MKGPLLADALAEFVQQARLAHARLGHDVDHAKRGRVASAKARSRISSLALAPDIGAEASADRRLEPRRALADRFEPIDLLRLGLALDRVRRRRTSSRPALARGAASPRSDRPFPARPGFAAAKRGSPCRPAPSQGRFRREFALTTARPELMPMRICGRMPCLASIAGAAAARRSWIAMPRGRPAAARPPAPRARRTAP